MSKNDTTVVKDGQLAIATVAQTGEFITGPSKIDATALVQTEQGPQLCVKTVNIGEGGGGSTVTVDDALSDTSENPVQNKVVTTALNTKLENKATGSNSLTILGTSVSAINGVNIGIESQTAQGSVAVGWHAQVKQPNAVAVGSYVNVNNSTGVAIGNGCTINASSGLYMIAIGTEAKVTANGAIQIGQGTNSTAKTFQVFTYQLLDCNTGLIPPERLGTGYDATKTQVLKHINGVATWVDEA